MMAVFQRTDHHSVALPLAILLLVSLPSLHTAPAPLKLASDKCDIVAPCRPGQASALGYNSGQYRYEFESEVVTAVTLPSPESRTAKVKAEVLITAFTPCDLVIKVKSLSVSTARDGQLEPVTGGKGDFIRFTLHDGIIGSVCASTEEPTWTANVKRAVISLLQNKALNGVSEDEVIESDISGRCPTKYTVSGDKYTKTKNLLACSHRDGGDVTTVGIPYEVNSNQNSIRGGEAKQTCEQTLQNGIFTNVHCTEVHTTSRVFEKSGVNIQTTVTTNLKLIDSKIGAPKIHLPPVLSKSSIYFDHATSINDEATKSGSAQLLRDTVQRIGENIRPDGLTASVSEQFLVLKNAFKTASPETVEEIYNEIASGSLEPATKEKVKKLYLDAAADSTSDGAIALLAKLIEQKAVDKTTKYKFHLHTTYASHPGERALRAILPLLSGTGQDVSKKALLTASGLAHQYCKITNRNCGNSEAYRSIADRLGAIVSENLGASGDEASKEVVVAALEALGNLDHLTPGAVEAILNVLSTRDNRFTVRALGAFRRDPCQAELKSKAQKIFSDVDALANVRISAYLANVRCLDASDAKVIQRVLDQEESIQVGGFIQSHLKNFGRSSSPSARQIQSAARQLRLNLKFPKEIRRFSRNLQSSFFNADLNVGYLAEGNVIFAKDSFIPKQLFANLTVDVRGNSYNLIDTGFYLDNVDGLQESLLGPEGKYPFDREIDTRAVLNKILKLNRNKRSIGPVQLHTEGVRAIKSQVPVVDRSSEPRVVDLYIRVFGTTLRTVSLNLRNTEESLAKLKEKVRTIFGGINSPSRELDVVNPILFLNDEVDVPTSSGLALRAIAEGTTIPSVDYHRTYQAQSESSPLDLQLKLVTNAATTLKARLSVVGGPFELGLQVEGSLRTGGAAEIKIHSDGHICEAKLNFPNEKVRAFELSSNVFWIQRGVDGREVKAPFRNSLTVQPGPETCDENPINAALGRVGLKFCYISNVDCSLNNPEPFLLRGKQYVSIALEKTEPSMQGYAITYTHDKTDSSRQYKLELDTPGSATDRKVTILAVSKRTDQAEGKIRKTEITVTAPVKLPFSKFEVDTTDLSTKKGIAISVIGAAQTVGLTAEVGIQRDGEGNTYSPLISFEQNTNTGKPHVVNVVKGTVVHKPGRSLSLNLRTGVLSQTLENYQSEAYVRGTVAVARSGSDFKYELTDVAFGNQDEGRPSQDVLQINGFAQRDGSHQVTDLNLKYGFNLEHGLTYKKDYTREPGHVKLDLKVSSDHAWFLNLDLNTDVTRDVDAGKYSSTHKLSFGPAESPRFQLSTQSNAVVSSKSNFDVDNKLKIGYLAGEQAHDLSLSTHFKVVPEEQLVDVEYVRNGGASKVAISFQRKTANNNDFKLNVQVKTQERAGEFGVIRTTLTDEESKAFTYSYKYDTTLRSSTFGLNDAMVTYVRLQNQPERKSVVVSSQITSSSERSILNGLALDFQLKTTPELYGAALGVKKNADEFVSLDAKALKTGSPTEPRVSVKAFVKNILSIDLTAKTPAEDQMSAKLNAKIEPLGRTITFDLNRKQEGDLRKLDADLKWDASRDPTQSIQVHSVTKITRGSIIFDSKNEITVIGKTVKVNLAGKIPDSLRHGEHSISLDVIGTEGQSYQIGYTNNVDISPTLRTSTAKLTLSVPEVPPTDIQLKVKSENPDLNQFIFDLLAELDVTQNGALSQSVSTHVKSQRENGERSVSAELEFGGERFPEVIKIQSNVKVGADHVGLKSSWKFGNTDSGIELDAERSVADNSKVRQVTFTLRNLPGVKYQVLEGRFTGKEGLGGELNIVKEREIKGDGKTLLSYRYAASHISGQLRASAQLTYKNRQILNTNLKGLVTRNDVDVSGILTGESFNIKLLTQIQPLPYPIGTIKFELESAAPTQAGITLSVQNLGGGKHGGSLTVKVNEKTVALNGEVTCTDTEHGIVLDLTTTPSNRHYGGELRVVNTGTEAYDVNGKLTVNDKSLAASGSYKKASAGGYEGKVEVEVPKESAAGGKGTYALAIAVQDNRRTLSLTERDAADNKDHLSLDYTVQTSASVKTYQGTFSTDVLSHLYAGNPPKLQGSFSSEIARLDKSTHGENGREFKAQIKLSSSDPEKLKEVAQHFELLAANEISVELKATNAELRAFGKVVSDEASKSGSAELQLKSPKDTDSPRLYSVKAILVHAPSGGKTVKEGFTSETQTTRDPATVDSTTKLYFGDENTDVISLHIQGKTKRGDERCEGILDLNLPSRQVSVSVLRHSAKSGELSVWLDKGRKPDQKLNVAAQFEPLQTPDGASGYKYEVTVTHPTLPKALIVKRKVVRFGSLVLHDSLTELDVFQDAANKILVAAKLEWTNEEKREVAADLSVKSEGLGLDVQGKGTVDVARREAHLEYSFKRPNGEVKARNVEIVASDTVQSLLIGDSSNPDLLISRTERDLGTHRRRRSANDQVRDVRYELKLPGMSDTRVVDVHLHGSVPPHINLKTFATGSGKSYEVALGYPSERQFLVGFYGHEGSDTTNLAQLAITLNRTQLLSIKVNWDKEALRKFAEAAKARMSGTENRLEDSLDTYVDQLSQDAQETFTKLTNALPDLAPFRSHVRTELQAIRTEISQNPGFNRVRALARLLAQVTKDFSEFAEEMVNSVSSLPEYLKNLSKYAPTLVKRYEKIVLRLRTVLRSSVARVLQTVRPIYVEFAKIIQHLTSRFQNKLEDVGSRAENTVAKVRAASDDILAKLIEQFLSRADTLSSYIESAEVQPEIKDLGRAVLNYIVARLKGENPDPEVLASQVRASLKKLLSEVLTVDVEHGELSLLLPLPRPVNSLLDVRTAIIDALPRKKTVISYRNRLLKPLEIAQQYVRDIVSTNFATAITRAIRTNAPPHPARAYIIGSQYFITFDGKLFHHEGHCQYLLVSDFPKNDFKVAIQFHNEGGVIKKTIIAADVDEEAVISPDNVVSAHGTGGPHIDLIDDDANIGFYMREQKVRVVCSKVEDVCVVDLLNGYLFGKVGGILGSYNNEPNDDLRTPAGQRVFTPEEFAQSWKLDAQCTEEPAPTHGEVSAEAQQRCHSALGGWRASLRSPYSYSYPQEFESICTRLSTEHGWATEKAVATAVLAYKQTNQGVSLYNNPFPSL